MSTSAGDEHPARRYLIVGGARGIGLSIAERLIREGATCVVTSRADGTSGQAEKHQAKGRLRFLVGNPGTHAGVTQLVDGTLTCMGGLDGLIYSAATAAVGPVHTLTTADVDAVFDVNVKGFLYAVQAALPHLQRASDPCVIAISSQAARRGQSLVGAYAASKGAVEALVRCLAIELAPRIRVNAVAPGIVLTDMIYEDFLRQAMLEGSTEDAIAERTRGRIPLRRFQEPESVAAAVMFLLSVPDVTGHILAVDGGMTA
jgi:NAD(P)-dependent dehydrogenase (short-subunit alcohol dehydrogenase family)